MKIQLKEEVIIDDINIGDILVLDNGKMYMVIYEERSYVKEYKLLNMDEMKVEVNNSIAEALLDNPIVKDHLARVIPADNLILKESGSKRHRGGIKND